MISVFIPTNNFVAIAVTLPVVLEGVVVLSLISLLVLKELLRAYDVPRSKFWNRNLNIAITFLLAAFSLIVIILFERLLNLS